MLDSLTKPSPQVAAAAATAAIASTVLAGFDRHYALFRYNAQQAKARWEHGDWHGIRRLARERIEFYDQRVDEAVVLLEACYQTLLQTLQPHLAQA